jgi:adenylate cyclase
MPLRLSKGLMSNRFSADDLPMSGGGSPPRQVRPVDLAHIRPFRIGTVEVRPATREVVGGNRREMLEPRVMQVLVALAGARGEILSRDDLIAACWEGRAVTDDAINRVLSRLRAVARTFEAFEVETITKVGYRLVGQERDGFDALAPRLDRQPSPALHRLCVLPFVNMSGDAEQEYFSDGITEDITTDLSKVSALAVTARHTAFTFKGQPIDVREVARRLGVTHVLEGSVRQAGGRLRITAQLIDGKTADHVWAERYDRDVTDIFAIQDEISEAIVAALKVQLLPAEKKAIEQRGTTDANAYNHYLMARKYWITGDFGDRRREERVIRLCGRAVEIDPSYAQAWALMGVAQANLFYAYSGNEGLDDGLAAAERATALDPTIAEAHLPRAWRFALAGRREEAEVEIQTALRLNPDSWEANKEAARILYRQGRLKEAIRLLEKACQLADSDFHSLGMLTATYLGCGEMGRVRQCAERLVSLVGEALARDPNNGAAVAFAALSHGALGQQEKARELIERAILLDPDNLYMRYNLAWPLIAFFRDTEAAIELLGPALARGGGNLISLAAVDQNLDPIRSDPRFEQMLAAAIARVGS